MTPRPPRLPRMPVLFQAHGAPPLLDDPAWIGELADWAQVLPRPQAIVVISAHWEAKPLSIGATRPLPLIYDFYGFPDKFYKLQYPAPGAPGIATRIRELMHAAAIRTVDEPSRGLDHGTYIPLMCMYPAADIPVLQISLPSQVPAELFAVGRALAPLRDEGVLLIGSGFLTHNLRALGLRETPAWAADFDAWSADVLVRRDHDALLDYKAKGPGVHESLPTHEHFVPVIVAAGAARDAAVTFPITGFWTRAGSIELGPQRSKDRAHPAARVPPAGWGGAMTRRSAQFD